MKKAIFYYFLLCSNVFILKIIDFNNFGISVYHVSIILGLIYVVFRFLMGKDAKIKYRRYWKLYVLLLIIMLDFFIIDIYSKDPGSGMVRSIAQFSHSVAFFIPFCFIKSKVDFAEGLSVYLFNSIIIFVDRIIAMSSNIFGITPGSSEYLYQFKESSFLFQDTNFIGGVAIILALLSLYKLKTSKNKRYLLLFLLNFINIFLTFSRTAYLVAVFAMLLYILLFIKKKETYNIVLKTFLFAVVLVLLIVFNFTQIADSLGIFFKEGGEAVSVRMNFWKVGLKLVEASPASIIWGYGKEGYALQSAQYLGTSRSVHNMYLCLLVEGGVILLTMVMLFFFLSVILTPKGIEKKFLKIGLLSYLLYSTVMYSFNEPFILIFTSFLLIGGYLNTKLPCKKEVEIFKERAVYDKRCQYKTADC